MRPSQSTENAEKEYYRKKKRLKIAVKITKSLLKTNHHYNETTLVNAAFNITDKLIKQGSND